MYKGSRVTEFALGGLALLIAFSIGGYILGFGLGQLAGKQEANTNAYARHAQDEIESACAGLNGIAQTECMVRVIEATNEHQRSELDLNAQRDMARWAFLMLVATVVMALITALGVYYVWRTLLATQKMSQDAREIGQKQSRAYVHVSSTSFDIVDENCAALTVSMHNSGISPAINVSIMSQSFFGPYPVVEIPELPENQTGYRTTLGPGGELSTTQRIWGDIEEMTQMIESRNFAAYIHGRVEYLDVFGNKRWVTFFQAYGGRLGDIGPNFHAYETGNDSN